MNFRKMMFKMVKKTEYKFIMENYQEIKENIHTPYEVNQRKLNQFLKFANDHSSYYKNIKASSITDYPILTKEILKRNLEDIRTVKKKELEQYPYMTTSGSYGTPFKFYVHPDKRRIQQAEVLYFGLLSGFDIGTKHVYCRALNPSLKKQILKNQYILKPEKINKEWIIKAIQYLQKTQPEVIISYPSTLDNIATFIRTYKTPVLNIKGIITIGEGLSDDARLNIHEAFGVEPYSRYSTEELGVLGNNYGLGSNMVMNQVNYFIEVLDENNVPVKEGEKGKVVVTDFNSTVTPLIRYDTGDIAIVSQYKDGLVYEISHLEGRKIEIIYSPTGEPITPFLINSIMRTEEDVLQFQFIQHSQCSYEMKILPINMQEYNSYENILEKIRDLLGSQAKIEINIVSEIETLPSGKRPYILNLYRKER